MPAPGFELERTLMDDYGHQTRGLQNRLRGAAEASWVGSIPIHPRHFPPVLAEMTAKMTAKTTNGFLNRLRFDSVASSVFVLRWNAEVAITTPYQQRPIRATHRSALPCARVFEPPPAQRRTRDHG
jgi:hypothetical protein